MTTATIIALTVAVCWLVVRDRRREVRDAGQRAVIAQQAATIMRERREREDCTPIYNQLRRVHDEFGRDLARIHDLDEWRGEGS